MKDICIFTGTRAEYGLLRKLILGLKMIGKYQITVLASGAHFSPEFGYTVDEIRKDGIERLEKCEALLSSDSQVGVAKAMGLGMIGYSEILDRIQPDLAIGLGDRFELLSFAASAMVLGVPLMHLHGGELTYGAIDDSIRHAITKMARYHCVSTEEYRRRVVQMGEDPASVINVGALGIDNTLEAQKASREELAECIPLVASFQDILVVTIHPETSQTGRSLTNVRELIAALDEFTNYGIVITGANADAEGRGINESLSRYASMRGNCHFTPSLGIRNYLGLLSLAKAVIGNSSSGIIEAPAMGVVTVDIGTRQEGRVRPGTVRHCDFEKSQIVDAIRDAIASPGRLVDPLKDNPYWHGGAVNGIISTIERIPDGKPGPKRFYDI